VYVYVFVYVYVYVYVYMYVYIYNDLPMVTSNYWSMHLGARSGLRHGAFQGLDSRPWGPWDRGSGDKNHGK
jgi:hypothetical protein